ncbi:MAG: DNA mismatch repair endonuclease MutL [Bacteroidota bacterium]
MKSTGYVRISGFIGSPEIYRKSRNEQFFFVNNRYIKSNYLHHAIYSAYQDFIPKETYPFYCIFLEIDPVHVDINIHPTKTEVKFDDEQTLYALLHSLVKRGLGNLHQAPEFDFTDPALKEAIYSSQPANPIQPSGKPSFSQFPKRESPRKADWEELYKPATPGHTREDAFQTPPVTENRDLFGESQAEKQRKREQALAFVIQMGERILTQKGDDLFVIDQRLAHQRILYENLLKASSDKKLACQQLLFPQSMEFDAMAYQALRQADHVLQEMGFEVKEFGRNAIIVYGTPSGISTGDLRKIFEQLVEDIQLLGRMPERDKLTESIARTIAMRSAVTSQRKLSIIEMNQLVEDLFRCEAAGFSPTGKPTFKAIPKMELDDFFQ